MKKTLIFVLMLIAALAVVVFGTRPSWEVLNARIADQFPHVEHIDGAEATRRMARPHLLIDARAAEEWAVSHLPGAFNCADVAAAEARIASHGDAPIIVYCSVGLRSSELAAALIDAGHEQVVDLRGGIFRWAAEQRPLIDADGTATRAVHPYNWYWGQLLEAAPASP